MPTVTLTFTLPEEQAECEQAMHAASYRSALTEFCGWLRSKRKHAPVLPTVDEIWDVFHQIVTENGISDGV